MTLVTILFFLKVVGNSSKGNGNLIREAKILVLEILRWQYEIVELCNGINIS